MGENGCVLDGQRFFIATDTFAPHDEVMKGFLYVTSGIDYPVGVPDETDPFDRIVGEPFIVGQYELTRLGAGFRLNVERFDAEVLAVDDILFARTLNMNIPLQFAND